MPRERPPTEEPTSSSKGAAPPEPPAEFPKPPEPRPKRKRSQKTEDTGEPRGKKKQPPAKTGSQEDNYLSLHQQKMHSALDDTLFVVKQKMRTRCRASRSLSTLDLDKFIACDDGEENDMRDQWNNSADKRDLESNISKRMMELWNICLRIYNCSPLVIISPLSGLVHQPTLTENATPPSTLWSSEFCSMLSILMTHGVWGCRASSLVTVLQFAVICWAQVQHSQAIALRIADGSLCKTKRI